MRCRVFAAVALATGVLLAGAVPASGQGVELEPFGGQMFSSPYHVASPPGDPDRVFVVEAEGTIRLVSGGATRPDAFLSIESEVYDGGEGGCECGLFSMAFAPDYASSGRFYVFYTRDAASQHDLVIEEFRRSAANPDRADPATRRVVLTIPHPNASNHNGGQLAFGPDGMLYIATGDGGNTPNESQSRSSLLGKLLRIDPRGSLPGQYLIPAGNPFADGPGGNADEIWALGLRNPYRFSFDRSTGDLIIGDVGEGAKEEIDYAPEGTGAGANFGWPCFEGTNVRSTSGVCAAPLANLRQPALEYPNPAGAAAVSGGFVVRDPALPSLAGRYVFADTYGAVPGIQSAVLPAPNVSAFTPLGIGLPTTVSFGQDSCGRVYVTSTGGQVSRLEPASGQLACKLAPAVTLSAEGSANAAKTGRLTASVSCDEDCSAGVEGSVAVRALKKRKGRKPVVRRFRIEASTVAQRLQRGAAASVSLNVPAGSLKRLRAALRKGAKATVSVSVTASGGGGGSATAADDVRVRKLKKPKRKKPKGKRRGR